VKSFDFDSIKTRKGLKMRVLTAAVVIFASLLCASSAVAQAGDATAYAAVVGKDEARFTMPVPARKNWKWRVPETQTSMREYMFSVKVLNEGQEFSFGFYLWKFPNSRPGAGRFSSLLEAGQQSLFARASNGHNIIIRDAGVKARQDSDNLVITVKGHKNVSRLFSGRPAEVVFQTELLGEAPTSQTVPVKYED
jgi:hypothetical protein